MTDLPKRPHQLRSAPTSTSEPVDPRVSIVPGVRGGRAVDDVAGEWSVAASVRDRWVRGFLRAAPSVVSSRPDPDGAGERDLFLAACAPKLRSPVAVAKGWAMVLSEGDVPE